MNLESDFKRVTGEDIAGVNNEILAIRGVRYPVDWSKVAEATKVLLDLPEMNLDCNDPESLLFNGNENN
jgi:hypothetical protein